MAVRDRLVAVVLAIGVLAGLAGWQALSPWVGIVVMVAALVAGCVIYRVDRGDEDDLERRDDEVSTRRRERERL